MTRWIAFLVVCWPYWLLADVQAGLVARQAMADLETASQQLADAEKARDRVRALTKAITAYEDGLGAVRDGLRQATIREAQLSGSLQAREAEIGQMLAALQRLGGTERPTTFLHPSGALGSARAGMLVADLAPVLAQEAEALRREVEDLEALRLLQRDAARQLQKGLSELQGARSALNTAMADRTELPQRFADDPIRRAILLASSETLGAFSSGLSSIVDDDPGWIAPDITDRVGKLPLPARGLVVREPDEPDAAGITRNGILLATRESALVTAPSAATLRYVGPLLDLGTVIILEPQPETLFIFAGLETAYGKAGQVVAQGDPLGIMGARSGDTASTDGDLALSTRSETLYIEIRQKNEPKNPLEWFQAYEDG
ncbi:MAG: peptidoglycan DD-metalloendopeptidase family protein [Pseudomonadota bacterium]